MTVHFRTFAVRPSMEPVEKVNKTQSDVSISIEIMVNTESYYYIELKY